MTADEMLVILKRDYGINSREELYEAHQKMPKLDLSMVVKRSGDEKKGNHAGDGIDAGKHAT